MPDDPFGVSAAVRAAVAGPVGAARWLGTSTLDMAMIVAGMMVMGAGAVLLAIASRGTAPVQGAVRAGRSVARAGRDVIGTAVVVGPK